MSTTPRTPEHFPRMKHRAAGRRVRKTRRILRYTTREIDRIAAAFTRLGETAGVAFETWQLALAAAFIIDNQNRSSRR